MVERGIWHIPEENISDWDSRMPVAQEDLNSKKITNKVPCSFGDILFNQHHKKILSVDEIGYFTN